MAGTANQKLKTLYIKRLLETETDSSHGVTLERIISYLRSYGIAAERKSIYSDLELLRNSGLNIGVRKAKHTEYMLMSRDFDLSDLKLMVDSVGSSRYITKKKSIELIRKISSLTSYNEAKELQRQVFVDKRVKTMEDSIYYAVDIIHTAISNNRKIAFKYFDYSVDKERVFRKEGGNSVISPIALFFTDGSYYLAGYMEGKNQITNYRVDRMTEFEILDEERDQNDVITNFDPGTYIDNQFSMFGGVKRQVEIAFHNSLATVVLDRFGTDILMRPIDAEHFVINTEAEVSPAFFSWIFMFGNKASIVGPDDVYEAFANMVDSVADIYDEEEEE